MAVVLNKMLKKSNKTWLQQMHFIVCNLIYNVNTNIKLINL